MRSSGRASQDLEHSLECERYTVSVRKREFPRGGKQRAKRAFKPTGSQNEDTRGLSRVDSFVNTA